MVQTLRTKQLALDASVWNLDSAPQSAKPDWRGIGKDGAGGDDPTQRQYENRYVSEAGWGGQCTAFHRVGAVEQHRDPRQHTLSFGYLLGAKDYKTFSWMQLIAATNSPMVNSPMNKEQTTASSAADFVSYYSRALQGEFFKNKETLNEYRRILSLGDAIWLLPLPLGGSAFCKGGSIDVPGFHAVCAPGGMVFEDRSFYFAFIINWQAAAVTDPQTVANFVKAASQAMTMVKDALATT